MSFTDIMNFLGSSGLRTFLIYIAVGLAFIHTKVKSNVYFQLYELAGWEYNPNEI